MEDYLIISSKKILNHPNKEERIDINSFSILTLIGKGAFGKVYLVRKKDNKKIYALKTLKKKKIDVLKQKDHVKTERHILGEIDHPFIVKLCYAFQTEKNLCLILEYCAGGELYSLLQKKSYFKEEQTKFYAAQLFLTLEYLHVRNIIYRDLKPENILIDVDGYIKLTDFGLSKRGIQNNQGAFTICGTPEYFAPELIAKNCEGHGKAVDWWSYGAVIYEMMTGLPPFYTTDKKKLYDKIMNEKITFPKNFNHVLVDFLERLLEKDPSKRMGCCMLGPEEIRRHKWFANIDWSAMLKKELKVPFRPILKSDLDTSYFDPQFTEEGEEGLANTFNSDKSSMIDHNINFEGFSYNLSLHKSEEQKRIAEENSKSNSLVESSYDYQSYGSSNKSNIVVFSNEDDKKNEITMEIEEENEFLKITKK